jgi:UDP-2,3-diacylglucosamine hydrolase
MGTKVFFASDFHFGIDVKYSSDEREKQVVEWLDSIKKEASAIFLLGDIFDYWFEYGTVIPKGFNRFLGKLKELRDEDISIFFFTGNHDMWMFDFFPNSFGIPVYKEAIQLEFGGKTFFLGHGDGLGPGDYSYKFIKSIFASKICQWLFARLHPNFGIRVMKYFSKKSRHVNVDAESFLGEEKEWLVKFANNFIKESEVDYFIFGHRHLPLDILLENKKSRYINLGDWMNHNSYAVFDGEQLEIKFYKNKDGRVFKNI